MQPSPTFYLVTYAPLACSVAGRAAIERHSLPPFVDGSIRREPDLEHQYPSISCLCRADKFAPRLLVGDFVAYMTQKARCGCDRPQRRLTALLRVHEILGSHKAAARWYSERKLRLPYNCVVANNGPLQLNKSHRRFSASPSAGDRQTHREWEKEYRGRAKDYPAFLVCTPVYRNLSWSAPAVSDQHLIAAFGKIPGSQNPGAMSLGDLRRFVRVLELSVPPSIC
jgi:hypothetical protein